MPGRLILPETEIVALADYRLRYAAYRSDPDLQRLHRLFPMIMMWDDHETANNSWTGGAQNHQPDDRRRLGRAQGGGDAAPIANGCRSRTRPGRATAIGDLADLFRPETRLTGRDGSSSVAAFLQGQADPRAALAAFRDGPWQRSGAQHDGRRAGTLAGRWSAPLGGDGVEMAGARASR